MKYLYLLFTLISLAFLSSCRKADPLEKRTGLAAIVSAPAGFTFETARNINFKVSITDTRYGKLIYLISIYDADPALGGHLLSKGSATVNLAFTSKVYLTRQVISVFMVKKAADNSTTSQTIPVANADITTSMN